MENFDKEAFAAKFKAKDTEGNDRIDSKALRDILAEMDLDLLPVAVNKVQLKDTAACLAHGLLSHRHQVLSPPPQQIEFCSQRSQIGRKTKPDSSANFLSEIQPASHGSCQGKGAA